MHKGWQKFSCLLLGGILLSGCSSEEDVIKMAEVPVVESAFQAETVWSHGIGSGIGKFYSQLQPVIVGEHIFAASRDGDVYAFDKLSGKELWNVDLSDQAFYEEKRSARLSGGLAAADGRLYVGSENGELIALSQTNGELLWHTDVGGEVLAMPATEAGKVVVSTSAGQLLALDGESGKIGWTVTSEQPNLTLRGTSAPVIAAGGVLYGRADGKIGIVILQNGQLVNETRVATPHGRTDLDRMVDVDAVPIIVDDELYAVAYNGQLVSRKLISGDELWKRKYASYQNMGIGVNDIVITDSKSHIYLVERSTGTEKWSNTQLEYRNLTAPLVLGDYVVVGDSEGYLYWISQTTGRIVSMQEIDSDGLYAAPIIDGDLVYIQTRGGELVALKRPL
ncbi:MAG: outer membrane protein assembly factor BamB [Gammaproteobacteria bacterium]|uniref:Outer membrane protein assembly factor BamB n=1 Tax=Tolumonas osonensis TaxID=675874 RepID=A0A841GB41_9GAMM|nr:outer membrane protein assembly factor BamB [Tolumonas osonensis]MBB6056354.1 outer membrane protein assembly factor BamB [Tolumonas osonensis]NCB59448.1 outer membrane protein assembly factor BamB [Gammaproteobacteria bacterium]